MEYGLALSRNWVKLAGEPRRFYLPPFFVNVASKGFSSSVSGAKSVPVWTNGMDFRLVRQRNPWDRRASGGAFTPPLFFVRVASKGFSSPVGGGQISVRGCERVLISK